MIRRLPRLLGLLSIGLSIVQTAFGQQSNTNVIATPDTGNYMRRVFEFNLAEQSRLYNGTEYQFYNPNIEGSAYMNDAKFFDKGSVVYDGVQFDDVPLMYDLHTDQVISLLYDQYNKFRLVEDKVGQFDLYNHHFIRISIDSADRSVPLRTGFYDEIYAGKISLVVKRTKELKETSGARDLKKYFLAKNTYFLKKEGQYMNVNSERSFINALGDKKKELQRLMKENKLNYRKNPEHAMVMLATYYDRLSN